MSRIDVVDFFEKWCKDTNRAGGILIGSSVREFLKELQKHIDEQSKKTYYCVVFKHPTTGDEIKSDLYTATQLFQTNEDNVFEQMCENFCDCQPEAGEDTNVYCKCFDNYWSYLYNRVEEVLENTNK